MLKILSAAHLNCCKGFRAELKQVSTTHRHFAQFWMILLQGHVNITVQGLLYTQTHLLYAFLQAPTSPLYKAQNYSDRIHNLILLN